MLLQLVRPGLQLTTAQLYNCVTTQPRAYFREIIPRISRNLIKFNKISSISSNFIEFHYIYYETSPFRWSDLLLKQTYLHKNYVLHASVTNFH